MNKDTVSMRNPFQYKDKGRFTTKDLPHKEGFPGSSVVKNLPANTGDMGSIPGLERSHMLWGNQAHVPQLENGPCSNKDPAVL